MLTRVFFLCSLFIGCNYRPLLFPDTLHLPFCFIKFVLSNFQEPWSQRPHCSCPSLNCLGQSILGLLQKTLCSLISLICFLLFALVGLLIFLQLLLAALHTRVSLAGACQFLHYSFVLLSFWLLQLLPAAFWHTHHMHFYRQPSGLNQPGSSQHLNHYNAPHPSHVSSPWQLILPDMFFEYKWIFAFPSILCEKKKKKPTSPSDAPWVLDNPFSYSSFCDFWYAMSSEPSKQWSFPFPLCTTM